jgi:hypothetical protein
MGRGESDEDAGVKLIIRLIILLVILLLLCRRSRSITEFVLAPVLAVQGIASNIELRNLHYQLKLYSAANPQSLPTDQFERFVREKFEGRTKDPLLDSWGGRYHYRATKDGYVMGSSGPDRRQHTADDIVIAWKER